MGPESLTSCIDNIYRKVILKSMKINEILHAGRGGFALATSVDQLPLLLVIRTSGGFSNFTESLHRLLYIVVCHF